MTIQKLSLSGTPAEIGYQHGELLKEQIHTNIEFYKFLFINSLGDQSQVLSAAKHFKESIRSFNPKYITEIDQIALSAGVSEPLWLYAINARTELSMLKRIHECTAVFCPKNTFLAQTWDWAQKLEGNFVLMEITFPDSHKILQLTEAGIIGKIGLNNQGLGVTLNYLYDEHIEFSTVPIHILLRQVLESHTLEDAMHAARKSRTGKASNLIVAQSGKAINIEFAGDLLNIYEIDGKSYVHTNHYLHAKPPNILDEESFQNSETRLKTAMSRLKDNHFRDAQDLIEILSDQSNGKNAILAKYKPDPLEMLDDYGTLATIIMDLNKRSMLVREGNPINHSFSMNAFKEYHLN